MDTPTFYLAECPVCDQGLVRIRTMVTNAHIYPICQCDECDAAWKTPSLTERLGRKEVDELLAACDKNHWSTPEEACLFGWTGFLRSSVGNPSNVYP